MKPRKTIRPNRLIVEKVVRTIFMLAAITSVVSMVLIAGFTLAKGLPAIKEIGLIDFVFGMKWKPGAKIFGIFPMIVASIYATFGAIVVGVPIGLLTAIFIAEVAPKWLAGILTPMVDLLAAIPSVVYGFFGLIVILPMIDDVFRNGGNSLLAVIIILGIMILPTIINISSYAIKTVPKEYKEGSLALGATKMQTIFKVLLPAARSGILAGVILGVGRAVGETMAVLLVAGNAAIMPESLLSRVRTLTGNIAVEMSYATGLHQEALFATGVVLFAFIILLNISLRFITKEAS
ncbi:phosphate ABC transporter permease subunit PstC [Acidaminobacter sp. JC074]|uniref:phosphate ABC transporter permease subunit PstC n=1 Tax=Acidaminobacter sp. JC074 TaxID=2530199 RepID=UPI001F0D49F3|nr:phosphate ABC transporter permease subunit PstC [Acidaminobacter sp. JC074]